jgi:hypothetical protein
MITGNKKAAATPTLSVSAGGSAGVAENPTVAPWLCDAVFRRLCSEQRTWSCTNSSTILVADRGVLPFYTGDASVDPLSHETAPNVHQK